MDISKEYIKMCDCPEIQGFRKEIEDFKDGDWLRCGMPSCKEDIHVFPDCYEGVRNIWLPRQDQIQEMLPENNCKCSCCLVFHLNKFVEDNIGGFFDTGIDSMEQYWLAFYMSEKHQKFWGKDGWEK
jgi:hypothetical protein